MAENKTQPTDASVEEFLAVIEDDQVREDCLALIDIMQAITKSPPVMWGSSIIGFGTHHYKYASGREGDTPLTGFSPRKKNISLYVMDCLDAKTDLLEKLGKVKHGKSCIYVKRLEDIHLPTLKKMIRQSVKELKSSGMK
ncbi:DUF1801 domain-containing protein [Planctomicrobium sp.]|jgi:hypothetical protein|nr:DUF1801 domain-containing protein [Planctomicrobium sp.]MDB4439479.1 DUF1801 domain-containing protein [Planctomicrobium sp.]